jgi:ribonucleoside-diphosphate reductase alpha chain
MKSDFVVPSDIINEISNFVFTSKYARYNSKKKRRETWEEAVDRLEAMHLKKYAYLPDEDQKEIQWAFDMVRRKFVAPSMRSLQFGGKAIEAHQSRIYNCAVRHVDSIRSFSEIFYLLLCGCGVGFGLSKHFVNRLPLLVNKADKTGTVITYVVEDSIEGWADSIEALLSCYMKNTALSGRKIVFDFSRIRKRGTPIKTGGGKAPGHEGLKQSLSKIKAHLDYIIEVNYQFRLKPVDAYDILMHVADAVLSGGIRRSATSVIFDKDDTDMMTAKVNIPVEVSSDFHINKRTKKFEGKVKYKGRKIELELSEWEYNILKTENKVPWMVLEPQRGRSNNSVLLLRKDTTIEEFNKIVESAKQYGEPGFVFANHPWQLFNPCFEIGFMPVTDDGVCGVQFCNLTTQNGVKITSLDIFKDTTKAATIIGTLQAGYTKFPYLSHVAKQLTDKEALLGVSITGMMDNPEILLNAENQRICAELAKEVNKKWAAKININPATRITCIKPEGTSSLVLGSGSGIHPQHAHEFIRRVQCNKDDNVFQHFVTFNPHVIEPSVWSASKTDDVISFPITIPSNALTKKDLTAIKHLEYVKLTQQNWVQGGNNNGNMITHNVSCTIRVRPTEWGDVTKYLFDNKEYFSAVSLLAASGDKDYNQAPNEEVTTEDDRIRFNEYLSRWKRVDYTTLKEDNDETELQQTVACSGGICELVT